MGIARILEIYFLHKQTLIIKKIKLNTRKQLASKAQTILISFFIILF